MRLKLLGTGGYHPNEVRHTPCLLLPEQGIAFDAGTAAFRLPEQFKHKELHLFLTHPHWDHIMGLTYLLVPMILGQLDKVVVYANRHTEQAIRTHLFAEPTFAHMPDFEFRQLEDYSSGIWVHNCLVNWQPLPSHPGGSVAYRVEAEGKSFAYITDTFVDRSYHDFVAGVGTLLHECYFNDEMQDWAQKTGHSYLSQVVDLACDVCPGQLLLTHMDPRIALQDPYDLSSAREKFAETSFAHDLQEIAI